MYSNYKFNSLIDWIILSFNLDTFYISDFLLCARQVLCYLSAWIWEDLRCLPNMYIYCTYIYAQQIEQRLNSNTMISSASMVEYCILYIIFFASVVYFCLAKFLTWQFFRYYFVLKPIFRRRWNHKRSFMFLKINY